MTKIAKIIEKTFFWFFSDFFQNIYKNRGQELGYNMSSLVNQICSCIH
jgi:hypothetical protein